MDIYEQMKNLNIILPPPSVPVGLFEPVVRVGNFLYVSGQGSYYNDILIKGKLGKDVTLEDGKIGARYCMLNTLAALQEYLGDLNRINRVIKLLGFISSDNDFHEQPAVLNGASQLLIDIFKDNGRHARSAIAVNTLPSNLSTEIESIFEIKV